MRKKNAVKKSRFTKEQIADALTQAETGTPVAEVIRRMGIPERIFCRWNKVDGGLGVGELRRVKQPEDKNRKALLSSPKGSIRSCGSEPGQAYPVGRSGKKCMVSPVWQA